MKLVNAFLLSSILISSTVSFAEEPKAAEAAVPIQPSLDGMIDSALTKVVNRIAGTKGRVAVMDFPSLEGRPTSLSSYISNKAGNKLIEVGRQVVDRATLEKVISEQKLQQNSLMDAATAARVGKLAGAGVFIIGNYTLLKSKFVLTVRALSVESGQFIPGAVAEETVKPLSTEMAAEIHELASTGRSAASDVNLDAPAAASDTTATKAEEASGDAAEMDFDKKVCAQINAGIPFAKMFKLAYDENLIPQEQLHSDAIQYSYALDITGESKPAITIAHWMFAVDNNLQRSEMGQAIKGKFASYPGIHAWAYMGANEFPGKANCAPHPGWWIEHREGPSAGKKKKK